MGGVPLHYVDLRTFCYATEVEQKVERALRTFLPEETEIDRTENEGHYGDPIVVLSVRLETADEIRHVLDRLGRLDEDAFETVLGELDERVTEDCEFFVKLDKQAAYRGEVALGDGIMLRAKVEAYPARKPAAVENAREALNTQS